MRRGTGTYLLAAVAVVDAEEGRVFVKAENRGVRVLWVLGRGGGIGERGK
jgi:hypothetical protein